MKEIAEMRQEIKELKEEVRGAVQKQDGFLRNMQEDLETELSRRIREKSNFELVNKQFAN